MIAQKKVITGTVLDNYGETIIGANVVEKGTANGVITDADGKFTISVAADATLKVSYIGYTTNEVSNLRVDAITIILQENLQALDEVIVIGYGTAKRKDFTGSVSSIRLEDSPIAQTNNLNALESIKGNVAGLDIGATNTAGGQPSMQMRGQKSISGSNDPLIVVDGIIYLGSINDINPNDIASYDILKDATSAAAYGSRSANGVIIISTKKGRSQKPLVSFNASLSTQEWYNRPELMKYDQWVETVLARNKTTDLSWLTAQEKERLDAGKETAWLDLVSRSGLVQDYQVSVSGSGEKMNYYVSTSYSDNKGIILGDDFNRVSALAKINADITSWLNIGVDAAFSRQDYSGFGADIGQAINMSPLGVVYRDEENKLLERYPYTQSGTNPIWGINDGTRDNQDIRHNYRANAYAVVRLPWMPELSYTFNFAGNSSKIQSGEFYYETYYVKEGVYNDPNRYSPATFQTLLTSANGYINNNSTDSWVIDNILNYKKIIGKHNIDLTAVATRDRRTFDQVVSRGRDYAANGNTTLGMHGLHKATTQLVELSREQRSNIGYLGRINYGFDNRYYLYASYRRDGASVFGTDNKWGDFAAAGVAWNVTNEAFWKYSDILNNLKLKTSYGKNGNQGLSPYGTLSTVNNGSTGGVRYEFSNSSNVLYGVTAGALGNASLGWESTASWNTGFESSWLRDRIYLDVDFYIQRTTDQIFNRTIPVMTGFTEMKSSMGEIGNTGLEITLRTINIERQDFNWMTNITFWTNHNKLIHLYGDDIDGDGKEDDDIANSRFIGKSLGAIFGYEQIGIVQEEDVEYMKATGATPGLPKYKDQTGDGQIDADDRIILGYSTPRFKLNMSNTVNYKNWQFYAMIAGVFGGGGWYQSSNTMAYLTSGTGLFNSNSIEHPWWTAENRSNVYPDPTFSGDGRFLGLQDRSFVRLQDITLSYTFREQWTKDLNISSLKLFLSGKNLLTVTGWEGGDPEVGIGVRSGTYPVISSFTLGANISF